MDEIFSFIEDANVDLDYDPLRRGPKFLNNMVATCRNLSNEVQTFEREVSIAKIALERSLNKLETEYELRFNDLMSNDEEVLRQPSAADRQSKADYILKDLRTDIRTSKAKLTDLGHVESIVQSKLRELRDVNSDIRLQVKLVQEEIKLGTFRGDETEESEHEIQPEEIDLEEEVLPKELKDKEVDPEEYEELFGSSNDDSEVDENKDDEFESALGMIDADASKDDTEIFEDATDDPLHQEIDYDDLLSGI